MPTAAGLAAPGGRPAATRSTPTVDGEIGHSVFPATGMSCSSESGGKALGSVMDRQHMKISDAHEPVDDTVRRVNDLPDRRIFEFRNRPARFREWSKLICGRDDA